ISTSEVITAPGATTVPGPSRTWSPQVARGSTSVANGLLKRCRMRSTTPRLAAGSPSATTTAAPGSSSRALRPANMGSSCTDSAVRNFSSTRKPRQRQTRWCTLMRSMIWRTSRPMPPAPKITMSFGDDLLLLDDIEHAPLRDTASGEDRGAEVLDPEASDVEFRFADALQEAGFRVASHVIVLTK